jgi:hypothetical protein
MVWLVTPPSRDITPLVKQPVVHPSPVLRFVLPPGFVRSLFVILQLHILLNLSDIVQNPVCFFLKKKKGSRMCDRVTKRETIFPCIYWGIFFPSDSMYNVQMYTEAILHSTTKINIKSMGQVGATGIKCIFITNNYLFHKPSTVGNTNQIIKITKVLWLYRCSEGATIPFWHISPSVLYFHFG